MLGLSDGATHRKQIRKMTCSLGCLSVSKILSKIMPAAPTIDATMLRIEQIFWNIDVFGTSRPLCLNHLSAMKARSSVTTVTADIAINKGLRPCAPTSEI